MGELDNPLYSILPDGMAFYFPHQSQLNAYTYTEATQTTDGAISDHSQTEGPVPEINFSDLEFGEQLGEGAFGVVHRGHWKSRDVAVAIKRVAGKINKTEVEHYDNITVL